MKKKAMICAAVLAVLVVGVAVGGRLAWKYDHRGEPDVTGMLVIPEDDGMVVIEEEQVPLADGPGGDSSNASSAASAENPYIQRVVDLVNAERANAGLAALEKSPEVCVAADVRAHEIAGSFSHTRPDGRRYRTVLADNGISSHFSGENIAGGYRSPEEVVRAWMGSEGHKENIMNPDYTHIGVGYYYDSASGMQYWSQLFIY